MSLKKLCGQKLYFAVYRWFLPLFILDFNLHVPNSADITYFVYRVILTIDLIFGTRACLQFPTDVVSFLFFCQFPHVGYC